MKFKSIPWWLWFVAIVLLVVATERMPYGYYTFTRIVVCGLAAYFSYVGWDGGSVSRVWSTIFSLVAVLFNPIVPIYLTHGTWYVINISIAFLFAVHLTFVRLGVTRTKAM
jgi:hypothetical protein